MPGAPLTATVTRESDIRRTPRVLQMASMFDLPLGERLSQTWQVSLPLGDRDWHVGLIVGPSGAGKTTIARELFGEPAEFEWRPDVAVVDEFPTGMGIKDVTSALSAVGFSSPPAWLRPFGTLSTGERFRVQVARALAESGGLTVVDEWTSTVDRQVAQVASHTAQKAVRKSGKRLVAVGCHYDVIDWLQPDWVYQPHLAEFAWRPVQPRPRVDLTVAGVDRSAWRAFRAHHYLSGDLHSSAKCFGAWAGDGRIVAFAAIRKLPHPRARNIMMGHRLVVLPDWQGLGVGLALDDWLGEWCWDRSLRYRNVVAHPGMIAAYSRSPRWCETTKATGRTRLKVDRSSSKASPGLAARQADLRSMNTRSFEYRRPAER